MEEEIIKKLSKKYNSKEKEIEIFVHVLKILNYNVNQYENEIVKFLDIKSQKNKNQ